MAKASRIGGEVGPVNLPRFKGTLGQTHVAVCDEQESGARALLASPREMETTHQED